MELHPASTQDDYFIGIFLGGHQDILATCITCSGTRTPCRCRLARAAVTSSTTWCPGTRSTEALNYVSYSKDDLVARVRRFAEEALRKGTMTLDQSPQLWPGLRAGPAGYTYLEREVDAPAAAMSGQRLRLVEKLEPGRSSTGT